MILRYAFAICAALCLFGGCGQPTSPPTEQTQQPAAEHIEAESTVEAKLLEDPNPETEASPNERLSVIKKDGGLVNDIGIATFPTPDGWVPRRSGGNTSVIFLRTGSDQTQPNEMISIDVGTAASSGVKQSAEALARKFSGTASLLDSEIDGETAYRVSIPPKYNQLMPRECIVVHRGNQVCFVFGASKIEDEIWPTVSGIAKSWSWK